MSATTRHPEYKHALPGWGAFKPSDSGDARRRQPDVSLEDYARERGLEFLDTKNPSGYLGVVPQDSRLQFNVLRGTLPGGRHGVLYHRLFAMPYDGSGRAPGVHTLSYTPKAGLRDALSFIPWAGHAFAASLPPKDKRPQAIGVPITVGASLVPETSCLPGFFCESGSDPIGRALGSGRILLEDFGVSGMGVQPTKAPAPPRDFIAHLMQTRFADVLRRHGSRPYMRLKVERGQLEIRFDGWLRDPAELDELAQAVSAAAAGLAEAAAPLHAPQAFPEPLPDPDWPTEPKDVLGRDAPTPPTRWLPWLHGWAERHGATPEDPLAYHRAFPRLPVPGQAFVVMRLTLPGTSALGRLAWHSEMDILTHNVGRNAVVLPAAPGTPDAATVRLPDLGLEYAVRDGLLAVWGYRRWQTQDDGMGDVDGLIEKAVALVRERRLAQL